MNNEVMARAITEIDDELIASAQSPSKRINVHRNRKIFSLCAVAACFVLFISGALLWQRQNKLDITVQGNLLYDRAVTLDIPAVASPDARKTLSDSISVSIDIAANDDFEIEAIDGIVEVYDTQTNEPTDSGKLIKASGNVNVLWTVENLTESSESTLRIKDSTLVLSYNKEENHWIILKK